MTAVIHHVRKISTGGQRTHCRYADDGTGRPEDVVGYAKKQLKMSDEIVIYRDQQRTGAPIDGRAQLGFSVVAVEAGSG